MACDGLMPRVSMHDFLAAAVFTAGSHNFLHYDLPMSFMKQKHTTLISPHAFGIACAGGAFVILWLYHPS